MTLHLACLVHLPHHAPLALGVPVVRIVGRIADSAGLPLGDLVQRTALVARPHSTLRGAPQRDVFLQNGSARNALLAMIGQHYSTGNDRLPDRDHSKAPFYLRGKVG